MHAYRSLTCLVISGEIKEEEDNVGSISIRAEILSLNFSIWDGPDTYQNSIID